MGSVTAGTIVGVDAVLVVEDEPVVRDVVVRYLSQAGYRTLEAADGAEAVEPRRSLSHERSRIGGEHLLPRGAVRWSADREAFTAHVLARRRDR